MWTYLSPPEIAEQLEIRGTPVCADTVRDLLDELGFVQRKAQKRLAMGATPFRNEQFENIARMKAEYLVCRLLLVSRIRRNFLIRNFLLG